MSTSVLQYSVDHQSQVKYCIRRCDLLVTIVLYKCTNIYNPSDEYGIKWDDADLNIKWGIRLPIISDKDNSLPYLKDQDNLPKY